MTIAILGGSFNPPHIAHQMIALYVLETQAIDELWLVPTFAHPFGKPLAPFEHRVTMCELVAEPLGTRVKVSRAEEDVAKQPGFVASRTIDLLELLDKRHPGESWRLVIGADILTETAKWHRWADVVAKAPPIVVGRPGFPHSGFELAAVSATRVRELAAKLTDEDRGALAVQYDDIAPELSALLPRTVLWYIARSGLYS